MADYQNPHRRVNNPLKSKAFSRYLGVSLVAIIVLLLFIAFIWLAGARQRGIPDEIDFIQLKTPSDNAPVVVFETNIGTMKAVLYPKETPEYFNYFKNLVESGYYNGTYICAVVDKAYALGGTVSPDPEYDSSGSFGAAVTDAEGNDETEKIKQPDLTQLKAEISDNLWPIRGALCSFIGSSFGKNYAGSSVIFVNDVTVVNAAYMDEGALKRSYGEELGTVFAEHGGIPNFSMEYTIFAQIYDGWDVFDAICEAEVLATSQPASDIVFEHVYLSTYGEES